LCFNISEANAVVATVETEPLSTNRESTSQTDTVMAVLDYVPYLAVCISVDGRPLQEYSDNEEELQEETDVDRYRALRTVSRCVESPSNKNYAIGIKLYRRYDFDCPTLQCYVKIDGKLVDSPLLRKPRETRIGLRIFPPVYPVERVVYGIKTGQTGSEGRALLKNFKFSEIEPSRS
jgi:hypothetical protein